MVTYHSRYLSASFGDTALPIGHGTVTQYIKKKVNKIFDKNSIRDARTPQPGQIVFNTMRYRSSETVHRLGYFQSSVSVQIMFK